MQIHRDTDFYDSLCIGSIYGSESACCQIQKKHMLSKWKHDICYNNTVESASVVKFWHSYIVCDAMIPF